VRLSARELHERAAEAREHYLRCDLCAHDCRVDRTRGPAGVCQEGDRLWLAGAGVHFGEEPRLTPSGLVLIGGCNLRCETCETFEFSVERRGLSEVTAGQLAALLLDLEKKGATNANFVTPTHVLPVLLAGLAVASEHGFALPVVWNCGGYESLPALRLLEGVVDIYLPDAKYGDDAGAFELSGCKGYTQALGASLAEMVRQVGAGNVIVRHLVLPEGAAAADKLMPLLAGISRELFLNVLTQYRPVFHASRFPVVSRAVDAAGVSAALAAARDAGLQNILLDGQPCPPLAAR
jgi:putative pyruvate formate lyase activating enzyme